MFTLCYLGAKWALKADGVLVVDVFFKHGIAAATYDPSQLTTDDLLGAIADAGQDICHYYDAELIGQEIAVRALHLER